MAVESVNGKTGVVVLTASNVEAVPTSEVGKPSGVASLNGSGILPESELPASTVSSSVRYVALPSTASTEAEKATANTAAIQAAINEGAGRVVLREGTYICNLLELKTGVILEGRGINATIIKLRSGANTDLLHSENWETLKAGNTAGGIVNGGFRNLSFDGNKANNTSAALVERSGSDGVTKAASKIFTSATAAFKASDVGGFLVGGKIAPGTTIAVVKSATEVELSKEAEGAGTVLKWTVIPPSSGLVSIYGKAYIAENFFVQNAAGHGLFSEWGNTGGSEMEAWVQNFKIINWGKSGLVWHGPHDSMINTGTIQGAEQYGVWTQGNAASEQFTNVHCWGETQKIAWCLEKEALLLGCQGEGAKECDVLVGMNGTSIRGGQFFLSPIGIKMGITGKEIAGCIIDTRIFGCSTTAFEMAGNDWHGNYKLDISPEKETAESVSKGSFAENSTVILIPTNEQPGKIQYPNKSVMVLGEGSALSFDQGPGNIGVVNDHLGFFGVTPIARPAAITTPAETTKANTEAIKSLITALKNLGLKS
jgi:hypothetical protein